MNDTLVSVCVPAYNCGRYIENTLTCLCMQSYSDIEIIVVNDGSTDDTLVNAGRIRDSRIRIFTVPNGGAARARNIAYGYASGEMVIFFDADDYVGPDFIEDQLRTIGDRKDVVVLSAWGRFYRDDMLNVRRENIPGLDLTFPDWIKYYWYRCNPMTNPGRALIPNEIIKKAGLWNESLTLNDDLEFFTRIFLACEKIIFNRRSLFYYRSGIGGLSSVSGDQAYRSLYDSITLSVNRVCSAYQHDSDLLQSCANMLQSYIYLVYPRQKGSRKLVQAEIDQLPSPDLTFTAGGYTRLLVKVAGWRIAKRVKLLISPQRK